MNTIKDEQKKLILRLQQNKELYVTKELERDKLVYYVNTGNNQEKERLNSHVVEPLIVQGLLKGNPNKFRPQSIDLAFKVSDLTDRQYDVLAKLFKQSPSFILPMKDNNKYFFVNGKGTTRLNKATVNSLINKKAIVKVEGHSANTIKGTYALSPSVIEMFKKELENE